MDSEVGVMSSLAGGSRAQNAGAYRTWERQGNALPGSQSSHTLTLTRDPFQTLTSAAKRIHLY